MKLKKEQKSHGELIILLEKVDEVDLGSSSKPILTIFAHPRVQKHLEEHMLMMGRMERRSEPWRRVCQCDPLLPPFCMSGGATILGNKLICDIRTLTSE